MSPTMMRRAGLDHHSRAVDACGAWVHNRSSATASGRACALVACRLFAAGAGSMTVSLGRHRRAGRVIAGGAHARVKGLRRVANHEGTRVSTRDMLGKLLQRTVWQES